MEKEGGREGRMEREGGGERGRDREREGWREGRVKEMRERKKKSRMIGANISSDSIRMLTSPSPFSQPITPSLSPRLSFSLSLSLSLSLSHTHTHTHTQIAMGQSHNL